MISLARASLVAFGGLMMLAALPTESGAQSSTPSLSESALSHQANGSFQPTVAPLPSPEGEAARSHGRYSLTKSWTGGMTGASAGELLGTLQEGSGAYVAIERFTGVLDGRRGGFSLVHRGQMIAGGAPDISVTIAPGTGEGELSGITGNMTLVLEGGRHDYVLNYRLLDQPR